MENRLINILVDFAFKRVFAGEGEESKHILKDFLNSILELKGNEKIKEIVYLNPFNDREHDKDKQSIMDIKVKTENDEFIDIEVQINDVDDYRKRSLYYWCKLYGETIKKGEPYYKLKKSIVINILDFNIINESNKYHNVFVIKERENNELFIEDLEIHYIELKKFKTNKNVEEFTELEEWLTFLRECSKNGDEDIINKLSKKKEEIYVAMEIMNKLSASEIEYQRYLAREKFIHDELSKKEYMKHMMEMAEEKRKKAEEEARKAEEEARKAEEEARKAEEEARKAEEEARKAEEKAKKIKEEAEKEVEGAKRDLYISKIELAKNLLDILDDKTIAIKIGLSVGEIIKLRQGNL